MLAPMAVEDITQLKAIQAFDNLAMIVKSTPANDRAWFVFDINATDAGDDENIIVPNSSTGRWFKMNNSISSYQLLATETNVTGATTVNPNSTELIRLVFQGNASLSFVTSIRDGKFSLFLDRNSTNSNVTWNDNRIDWTANRKTVFSFNNTDASALLEFFSITALNTIRCTNIIRY
ncbi:MAG: hypothetical protein CV045_02960 [Cyanobacteria bacterium M5B4]|nr:MAG: hypothetical protein CV045_02960 [Cyanobacteria bacterium M5B4]